MTIEDYDNNNEEAQSLCCLTHRFKRPLPEPSAPSEDRHVLPKNAITDDGLLLTFAWWNDYDDHEVGESSREICIFDSRNMQCQNQTFQGGAESVGRKSCRRRGVVASTPRGRRADAAG